MKKVRWLFDHFEEGFMIFGLGAITVAMFAQVVSRYVFQSAFVWTEELSRYFFILMAFSGLSYGVRSKAHLRVDLLETTFPKLKFPLEILCDAFIVALCVFLLRPAFDSVEFIRNSGQVSPAMSIPMYIVYIPLAAGLILTLIRMAEKYIKYLLEFIRSRGNHTEEEV